MIVVAIVLLAAISYPVWLPKATLAVGGQISITIHLTPQRGIYGSGEQVTAYGTVTCSGLCPLAAMPYPDMDVLVQTSWGWSKTVTTSSSGAYSVSLTLPTANGNYWVGATCHDNGVMAFLTVGTNNTVPIPELPVAPFALLLSLSCLLLVTKRYSGRVLIVRG